jgi:hypothetical protein
VKTICLDGRDFVQVRGEWQQVGETIPLWEVWWCKGGLLHVVPSRGERTLCGCSTEPRAIYATAEGEVVEQVVRNWQRAPPELVYPWLTGPRCWKCERALMARLGIKTERVKV